MFSMFALLDARPANGPKKSFAKLATTYEQLTIAGNYERRKRLPTPRLSLPLGPIL
jgi:hypothetical protein